MAEFGKLNFSVSFNPTSAFPLDARYYFDSLTAAQAAATAAVEVGSSEGTYYYGETVAVVEGGTATLYIIQPDKTLEPVKGEGASVEIDETIFEKSGEKLTLKGYAEAENGSSLVKGEDGNATWQKLALDSELKTLSGTVGELNTTVTGLSSKFDNYYDKNTVDSKIASAGTLKRTIVESLPEVDAADMNTIYMVAAEAPAPSNSYDEYLVIEKEGVKSWEKIGNTSVDLEGYVTDGELTEALNNKVDKIAGSSLVPDTQITKLSELLNIKSVEDGELNVDGEGKLSVVSISQDKVSGLTTALAGKVDAVEGSSLLTKEQSEKLASIANGAEKNVINSVNEAEFTISDRLLAINKIPQAKVDGLTDALAGAENKIEKITLGTTEAVIGEGKNVTIPIAAESTLGLVTTSSQLNGISVAVTGEMSVNSLSTDKLVQGSQTLILNGGNAAGTYKWQKKL